MMNWCCSVVVLMIDLFGIVDRILQLYEDFTLWIILVVLEMKMSLFSMVALNGHRDVEM